MMEKDALQRMARRVEDAGRGSLDLDREVFAALGAVVRRSTSRSISIRWSEPEPERWDFDEGPSTSLDACAAVHHRFLPECSWFLSHPGYDDGVCQDGKTRAEIHHPVSSGGGPSWVAFAFSPARAWLACILRSMAGIPCQD
jgi:hypothetical protein